MTLQKHDNYSGTGDSCDSKLSPKVLKKIIRNERKKYVIEISQIKSSQESNDSIRTCQKHVRKQVKGQGDNGMCMSWG